MIIDKKYERVGHLFQDRFKSERIETEAHLLCAVRYIHKNPVKAGIANHEIEYKWSSFSHYLANKLPSRMIEADYILGFFSENREIAVRAFTEFSRLDEERRFLDYKEERKETAGKLSSQDAVKYLESYLTQRGIKVENLKFNKFSIARRELILYLKTRTVLSVRDIAKLLDVNRGMVDRIRVTA